MKPRTRSFIVVGTVGTTTHYFRGWRGGEPFSRRRVLAAEFYTRREARLTINVIQSWSPDRHRGWLQIVEV